MPEVWFSQDDGFRVWHLQGNSYQTASTSAVLPWIDLERLANHVRMDDQVEAVAAYLAYLRE